MAHSDDIESLDSQLPDPNTGKPIHYADFREEFERITRQTPRNPEAERAFILNKIEMVRKDPHLTEDEKKRAIADLEQGLARP